MITPAEIIRIADDISKQTVRGKATTAQLTEEAAKEIHEYLLAKDVQNYLNKDRT